MRLPALAPAALAAAALALAACGSPAARTQGASAQAASVPGITSACPAHITDPGTDTKDPNYNGPCTIMAQQAGKICHPPASVSTARIFPGDQYDQATVRSVWQVSCGMWVPIDVKPLAAYVESQDSGVTTVAQAAEQWCLETAQSAMSGDPSLPVTSTVPVPQAWLDACRQGIAFAGAVPANA